MGKPVIKGALLECEQCGVQRVMLRDLVMRVGVHNGRGVVRYQCRGCGEVRFRPLDAEKTTEMACTDITIEWWEPSPEVHEHDVVDAITGDDIGEFRRLLADDHALAEVISTLSEELT
jgi:uncharacterized Zn finger protein